MNVRIIYIAILSIVSGCGVVPIQMVRVTQSESYIQTFSNLKVQREYDTIQTPDALLDQNKVIDDAFEKLLGEKNWQNIKDIYGLKSIRDELLNEKVIVRGMFSFNLYINPYNKKEFYMQGQGRYFIIRTENDEIMLSGDFCLPLQMHAINSLDKGYVIIDVELFTTRVPEQVTYINQVGLKYKVYIDASLSKYRIYALDYSKCHEVYLIDDQYNQDISNKDFFSRMFLVGEDNEIKYIDLRGMPFLRKDYKKLMKKTKQ